jgi:hypothetical protein
MIIRNIYIEQYRWHVHCYFAVNKYYTEEILDVLESLACSSKVYERVAVKMEKNSLNAGFTYSNKSTRETLMVVGRASSNEEYINSITHELRHLCDDIASVAQMQTSGEEVAYLAGDIASKIADVIQVLVCNCLDCLEKRYKKIRPTWKR